ncbi:MAG: hypothetical protein ACYTEX_08875 [Planctomycetota bacterium]
MTSDVAKGWMLCIAVGLCLIAAGHIVDFLLKKAELRKLHAWFLRWAKVLSDTPIQRWQVRIANVGYNAIHALHSIVCATLGHRPTGPFHPITRGLDECRKPRPFLLFAAFSFILPVCAFGYFVLDSWVVGSIALPFVAALLLGWCHSGLALSSRRVFTLDFQTAVMAIALVSTLLSLCATLLTLYGIPEHLLNTRWYVLDQGWLQPAYPLLLPVLNLPFDLATIAVTLRLLGYVRRRRSGFLAVAVLDTVLSLAFSVLLYAVLLAIEAGWDFLHFHRYVTAAVAWLADVGGCFGQFLLRRRPIGWAGLRDVHLLPILLTTFVPVALYMGVFIFLAFCTAVMRLAARVFAVIGERDQSVFKQFATLLAVILAAVKAIYDWLSVT